DNGVKGYKMGIKQETSSDIPMSLEADDHIFGACGVALAELTHEGRVLRLNPRMENLLEVDKGSTPVTLSNLLAADAAQALHESLARAMEGTTSETDGEFILEQGRRIPVRLSIAP